MLKKVWVCVVIGLVAAAFSGPSASALPPFNKEWKAKYLEGNSNAKFVEAATTANCNVCHVGEMRKNRNEYGKAVGKFLTKAKYNEIKADEAAGKKYIIEGLAKAEAEKGAGGKSYGDLIKAGQLPSGDAK